MADALTWAGNLFKRETFSPSSKQTDSDASSGEFKIKQPWPPPQSRYGGGEGELDPMADHEYDEMAALWVPELVLEQAGLEASMRRGHLSVSEPRPVVHSQVRASESH